MIYDQTGNRIFTGGDDNLVKVWCADTGWLLHTIRAHQTITRNNTLYMIIDLDIDSDNTILVSSSSDKTIRVWDLKTFDPISYIHVVWFY
jgi:WD40 repeat protein